MATSKAAARTTTTSHLATKKSCDLCVSRKRKCDGSSPCSFCVSRGRECHYSPRRPNRPRGYAKRLARGGGAGGLARARCWSGMGGGEEKESAAMQMQMQRRHQDPPTLGWKRVRLSASPATGLVGMEENCFLGWFFDCLGFLPLTNESLVRGAIMEVFLGFSPEAETAASANADRLESPPVPANAAEEGGPGTGTGAGAGGWSSSVGGQKRQRVSDAASTCTLWCAVAMGALVQGQPPERVAPYMRLAWMSLSQCFDTVTAETARAFMMMAYLYNFLRNDHKFYRYLLFAKGVVNRLPDNTPEKQEIVDLLARANDTRIYHTSATEPGELDAYSNDDKNSKLQVPDVVSKSSLCRLLLEADRRMIKAFLRDHKAQVVAPPSHGEDHQSPSSSSGTIREAKTPPTAPHPGVPGSGLGPERREGAERREGEGGVGGSGSVKGAGAGDDGGVAEISAKTAELSMSSNTMADEADPCSPGDQTSACTEEAQRVFAQLQDTAKIPEIGSGVGGVIYNAIFGYLDIVAGGPRLILGIAKIKQCAKVFVRYPGLSRFSTWLHLSHCLLSLLAELEDTGPFEELRYAYNSVRGKNELEVPPHGEWTMVGFCGHIFCRSIDHLDKKDAPTTRIKHDCDAGAAGDAGEADQDRAEACDGDTDPAEPPRSHSTTVRTDQTLMLPKTEWPDESLEMTGVPTRAQTLQPVDLASVAGLSGVGPVEPCQSVVSMAGIAGVAAPAGGLSGSGATGPATFGDNQATRSQDVPAPPAKAILPLGFLSTGAPVLSSSGVASQQQQQFRVLEMPAQVTDTAARQAFGEKVAHWGERRDGAVIVGGGDAGGDGKASVEQSAFGLKFFWPHER